MSIVKWIEEGGAIDPDKTPAPRIENNEDVIIHLNELQESWIEFTKDKHLNNNKNL